MSTDKLSSEVTFIQKSNNFQNKIHLSKVKKWVGKKFEKKLNLSFLFDYMARNMIRCVMDS